MGGRIVLVETDGGRVAEIAPSMSPPARKTLPRFRCARAWCGATRIASLIRVEGHTNPLSSSARLARSTSLSASLRSPESEHPTGSRLRLQPFFLRQAIAVKCACNYPYRRLGGRPFQHAPARKIRGRNGTEVVRRPGRALHSHRRLHARSRFSSPPPPKMAASSPAEAGQESGTPPHPSPDVQQATPAQHISEGKIRQHGSLVAPRVGLHQGLHRIRPGHDVADHVKVAVPTPELAARPEPNGH